MRLGATDLIDVKVIDRIVPEPVGGAHRDPNVMFDTVTSVLDEELRALEKMPVEQLVKERREKFYQMGVWTE